jgi:L-lactate dehydrogenase complex protein LldE
VENAVAAETEKPPIRVGLFVTCLVDLIRPSVGFAAVKLLEDAGCEVVVPSQSCCGQPAFNSGDRATARAIALKTIDAFAGCDYVVAPSGSCAGMLAKHYPELFADEPELLRKAAAFADKCWELTSFLVDRLGVTAVAARCEGVAAYHDSCAGLREMGVKSQPRALLASVEGLRLVELQDGGACCGFGGVFSVKHGALSGAIVERKAADVAATGADTLIAGDLGCLMNIAGRLQRQGRVVKARHVAEVLAGVSDEPPIGEAAARVKP